LRASPICVFYLSFLCSVIRKLQAAVGTEMDRATGTAVPLVHRRWRRRGSNGAFDTEEKRVRDVSLLLLFGSDWKWPRFGRQQICHSMALNFFNQIL
jgi:hypothetical protein